MKKKTYFKLGLLFIVLFIFWTLAIQMIDVQPKGINGTNIGFATMNLFIHHLIGTNMTLYIITDWLGLIPFMICFIFALLGLCQWIQKKNLFKVDADLFVLGFYYLIVIGSYLIFEMIPINYRPILIDGRMEVSYPSSTTLLTLSVMLSFYDQLNRRVKVNKITNSIIILFTLFMVIGRLISGVHWLSDIVGAIGISFGYYYLYKYFVS